MGLTWRCKLTEKLSNYKSKKISTAYQELITELEAIGLEKENIRLMLNSNKKVSDRSETVYLHIIGAMLTLLLGHSPSGKPHSVFRSQSAIVDALIAHNKELPGVSKRTLDEKFAAAKRSLSKR
ncbi:protein kinase [Pseudomonas sp. Lb2C1-1]|uniref:protein kinase n=1 Tax=Pseudomonas TaxID=286 RepID=UPI00391954EB